MRQRTISVREDTKARLDDLRRSKGYPTWDMLIRELLDRPFITRLVADR